MKYNVIITETLEKVVTVEASSAEEAKSLIERNYYDETDGFVLTADDYTDTEFTVSEVEENENAISYTDKIAAAKIVMKLLKRFYLDLCVANHTFHIVGDKKTGNNEDFIPIGPFNTLAPVVDSLDEFFSAKFLSGILTDNRDRRIYILLNSDYFADILSTIDVSFYIENLNVINGYDLNNEHMAEKYLIKKIIAKKVIDTQSGYLMTEYENKIYLSNYAAYDDCENPMESFMADIIEYNNSAEFKDKPFTIFHNYTDVIKTQMQQIKDDYRDLAPNDFYLSFEEIAYLGKLED